MITGIQTEVGSTLRLLLRRKKLIVLSGVVTACVALAIAQVLPPQYSSEGSLIVETRSSGESSSTPGTVLSGVLTQMEVLQSRGLIRQVVENLDPTLKASLAGGMPEPVKKLMEDARDLKAWVTRSIIGSSTQGIHDQTEDLIRAVQQRLHVEAKENSSLISIHFRAGTPTAAAAILNAIMATYMDNAKAAREAQIARTDQWIAQRSAADAEQIAAAEKRIAEYLEAHDLHEVQGSLTSAVQLSKTQAQLVVAREDLARQRAALETITHGNGSIAGASETLGSKTIQTLKEFEARIAEQMARLGPVDPRRAMLQAQLDNVHASIKSETQLVLNSISRDVDISTARVRALEKAVEDEATTTQASTVAGYTMKQLTGALDARRQLYVSFLTTAEQARTAVAQIPVAHVLFSAVPPLRPANSLGMLALVFGLLGGSAGAAGGIVLKNSLSRKIRSTSELAYATQLPVFGSLPNVKRLRGGDISMAPEAASMVSETFRAMWVRMRFQQNKGTAILITSSEIGEGKTTVAVAMARRLASDGFRVLLVDADMRRPRLSEALNLHAATTLETVLEGGAALESAVVRDSAAGPDCLLSDGSLENPLKQLSSGQFRHLLEAACRGYDFVVLDSPPVLHVADSILIGSLSHYILFVVQALRLRGDLVNEATRRFNDADREKILTLLTKVPAGDLDQRDYYRGYTLPQQVARLPSPGAN